MKNMIVHVTGSAGGAGSFVSCKKKNVADQRRSAEEERGAGFQVGWSGGAIFFNKETLLK